MISLVFLMLGGGLLDALPSGPATPPRAAGDWLLDASAARASVWRSDARTVTLSNGLVARTWRVEPDVVCIGFDDLMSDRALLRAVEPELRASIDGTEVRAGGLVGPLDRAYLRHSDLDRLALDPTARHCTAVRVAEIPARFEWKRLRHGADLPWPPPGQRLTFAFSGDVEFEVHYDLYDGLPLVSKSVTLRNRGASAVQLDSLDVERLAFVEADGTVEPQEHWRRPDLHVESDYAFHGMSNVSADVTTRWLPDRGYATQVSYALQTPCLLVSTYPVGPHARIGPGGSFESYRVHELVLDGSDRERNALAQRRMYRTLAPWVTENPLMMHIRDARTEAVKLALDQCAAVGFEMAILSFGSGFDVENRSSENLARAQELVAYARERGVELGTYSLLASRAVAPEHDVVDRETNKPGRAYFGNSPCLCSEWGEGYFAQLRSFYSASGMSVLEHDGSYPGDTCASTSHSGHRGFDDSQWAQFERIRDFYGWCRSQGVYLNVPDWYFLNGSNKTGMGYRETNWSLPRAEQLLHARQNIFDGTWTKTPSMGWMFVPLTEYHGGGAAATLEPLHEHLEDYERHLATNLGAGVQACWRGPRLFDTDATRALVVKWVAWYKAHREVLESDLLHLRRADGRDLDGWVHVNPRGQERALAMLFNPLPQPRTKELEIDLYYAGLVGSASVQVEERAPTQLTLDARSRARVSVSVPAGGFTWLVFRAP
ncbi:MAG: alpha-galactosidase [Planctomycetes bacterium]|nr:alpha-galactosidase [Planctomycetota bacterium]